MSTYILGDTRRNAQITTPDMGDSESGSSYAGSDGSPESEQFPGEALYASREQTLLGVDSQAGINASEERSVQGRRSSEVLSRGSDVLPVLDFRSARGVLLDQLDALEGTNEQHRYQSGLRIEPGLVLSRARGDLADSVLAPPLSQEVQEPIQGQNNRGMTASRMTEERGGVAPLHTQRSPISTEVNDIHRPSLTLLPNDIPVLAGRSPTSHSIRDVILPRWQPDAGVTYCPICRTQFSFFVRKHHCRKCGRVVCNACSPHRITIPYQYIVQLPPLVPAPTQTTPRPNTDGRSNGNALVPDDRDGGMKVRLCNPCVPDPNTLPPQPQGEDGWRVPPPYYVNLGNRPRSYNEDVMNYLHREMNTLTRDGGDFGRPRGMGTASGLQPGDRGQQQTSAPSYHSHSTNPAFSPYSTTPTRISGRSQQRLGGQSSSRTTRSTTYSSPDQRSQSRGHTNRHQSLSSFHSTSSASNPQPHYRSLLEMDVDQLGRMPQNNERPLPPIPRIREEDECPVCHNELPSQSLPDFENLRAAHITQCINNQIALHNGHATRPAAYTSQSQPVPTASSNSSTSSVISHTPDLLGQSSSSYLQPPPSAPIPNTPEGRMAAREQAHTSVALGSSNRRLSPLRRTGMFLYTASEKDCVDEAECTICLEEFEPGAGMARLECFCRFHRRCIQAWFVEHPGRCPVHQHDGYGF